MSCPTLNPVTKSTYLQQTSTDMTYKISNQNKSLAAKMAVFRTARLKNVLWTLDNAMHC